MKNIGWPRSLVTSSYGVTGSLEMPWLLSLFPLYVTRMEAMKIREINRFDATVGWSKKGEMACG